MDKSFDFSALTSHYKTPDEVYERASGGGACIVDKDSQTNLSNEVSEAAMQQQAAA